MHVVALPGFDLQFRANIPAARFFLRPQRRPAFAITGSTNLTLEEVLTHFTCGHKKFEKALSQSMSCDCFSIEKDKMTPPMTASVALSHIAESGTTREALD
jgi:hypothetical protein